MPASADRERDRVKRRPFSSSKLNNDTHDAHDSFVYVPNLLLPSIGPSVQDKTPPAGPGYEIEGRVFEDGVPYYILVRRTGDGRNNWRRGSRHNRIRAIEHESSTSRSRSRDRSRSQLMLKSSTLERLKVKLQALSNYVSLAAIEAFENFIFEHPEREKLPPVLQQDSEPELEFPKGLPTPKRRSGPRKKGNGMVAKALKIEMEKKVLAAIVELAESERQCLFIGDSKEELSVHDLEDELGMWDTMMGGQTMAINSGVIDTGSVGSGDEDGEIDVG